MGIIANEVAQWFAGRRRYEARARALAQVHGVIVRFDWRGNIESVVGDDACVMNFVRALDAAAGG